MINYANPTQYGYGYSAPRPQARNTQPLTPEQIAKLRQDSNAFDMKVEQEDLLRAACTHKEKNGASTLIQNNDDSYTCTICHKTFRMCDHSKEKIEAIVNDLIDVLQTAKTLYLDAPENLVSQYFQMIPLLEKFPDLWDRAIKNFSMYEGAMNGVNPMSPGFSGFAAMQNLLTNPYAGYNGGYAPQPQYPGYAPAPMQQPYYGAYQQPPMGAAPVMDPAANPMAYGTPSVNTAPAAAPVPGVMPGVPQPAPAPAVAPATAPAQQAEVQQQQVFNV